MNLSHIEVDAQHQYLISMLDGVRFAIEEHTPSHELNQLANTLQSLFITHFSAEERVYEDHRYPESQSLKQIHLELLNDVSQLKRSLASHSWHVALELLESIKFTFLSHVTRFDDQFAPEINI